MVLYCKGCQCSYNEGETCDCDTYGVSNSPFTPGEYLYRTVAERVCDAAGELVKRGLWAGGDIYVVSLRKTRFCHWFGWRFCIEDIIHDTEPVADEAIPLHDLFYGGVIESSAIVSGIDLADLRVL